MSLQQENGFPFYHDHIYMDFKPVMEDQQGMKGGALQLVDWGLRAGYARSLQK